MISKTMTFLKTTAMQWTMTYYVLFICLGLGIGLMGPTLPSLADQTQTSSGEVGALFTASAVGALLGTLLGGRLFDRVRGHPALGIAQLLSAALIALYPLLPSVWLLFIVAFGKGMADGFINTGANTLLVWTHRAKSSPYMNALHFFFGLGAFLAPFLVAQLLTISGGYRWAYWALAVVGGLAGLRLLTLKGNPQHAHTTSTTETITTHVNYPLVIAAMLFLFFYVGAEIAFSGWIYTYARSLNLAEPAMAAYLTSGFWLTFTIGRLISIPLATRFKPQQLIAAALTGCLSILIVALIIPMTSTLVWILALTLGLCMAPIWPSGFTLAGQSMKLTARASGIILLGDSLGFMILPWLAGKVLDGIGPQTLIYLVTTSLFFNLIAFVAILRVRHTRPAAVAVDAAVLHE